LNLKHAVRYVVFSFLLDQAFDGVARLLDAIVIRPNLARLDL
jgi:hypothetical protein